MTRLLSQFVLSRFARHKLRQLRLAGEAYVRLTLRAEENIMKNKIVVDPISFSILHIFLGFEETDAVIAN